MTGEFEHCEEENYEEESSNLVSGKVQGFKPFKADVPIALERNGSAASASASGDSDVGSEHSDEGHAKASKRKAGKRDGKANKVSKPKKEESEGEPEVEERCRAHTQRLPMCSASSGSQSMFES